MTTYRVTCWNSRKGTEIPGTMTTEQVEAHLSTCRHRHGMTDTRYGNAHARRSGPTVEVRR